MHEASSDDARWLYFALLFQRLNAESGSAKNNSNFTSNNEASKNPIEVDK